MSCHHCGHRCDYCDEEESWKEERKKKLKAWCESHNWNSTPAEVARDIQMGEFDPSEIWDAMKGFGYSISEISAVKDCYEVFC